MTSDSGPVGPPVSHLIQTDIDGHVGLYNPVTARVHVLNGTASDAWLVSDGEHTAQQIVDILARAYQIEPDEIRAAVLAAIGTFQDQELLCREDGPT